MSQFEYEGKKLKYMDGLIARECWEQDHAKEEPRELDLDTIQNVRVADIDMSDYPDFCDAFIDYAEHEDGTPLETWELDQLSEDREYVNKKIMEKIT